MERKLSLALGVFLVVTAVSISSAGERSAIALISSLSGKVEVRRSHQKWLKRAHLGDQLFESDVLYTHKKARASLLLSDGQVITIYPDSRLELSLRGQRSKKKSTTIASLSKGMLKGFKGVFSPKRKRESLTAVPGIRKKAEKKESGVKVLYPRNSMILTPKPHFRWMKTGQDTHFMISLTVKGMEGRLWTLQTSKETAPYPKGRKALERGRTYFLRAQSRKDSSIYDEVYFMVLDNKKAEEVSGFVKKMEDLRKSDPQDHTPHFLLANYYRGKGLYHEALGAFEALEKKRPGERFVLEGKREIFAKLGFWEEWKQMKKRIEGLRD